MTFNEVKVGGKYWHVTTTGTTNVRTGKKHRVTKTIRVVEINTKTQRICASVNGAPAEWLSGNTYRYWQQTNPELKQQKEKDKNGTPKKSKRPISRFIK